MIDTTIHILSGTVIAGIEVPLLCGKDIIDKPGTYTYIDPVNNGWALKLEPNCEACLLIAFYNESKNVNSLK